MKRPGIIARTGTAIKAAVRAYADRAGVKLGAGKRLEIDVIEAEFGL